MSRYVNLDQIIADIYEKWGRDPAYIANDTPTGIEARRDAKFVELLRSEPSIDIVRCRDCKHAFLYNRGICCGQWDGATTFEDGFCWMGERSYATEKAEDKANE